jgi:GntR family transcriptional regulator/MocR family aminotransferase
LQSRKEGCPMGTITKSVDTKQLAGQLLAKGVSVIPTEPFSFEGNRLNALRLGYTSLSETEMESGLQIIRKLL